MPGAQVSEVARQHGATRWQVYDWRRRLRQRSELASREAPGSTFASLRVEEPLEERPAQLARFEIAIGDIVVRTDATIARSAGALASRKLATSFLKKAASDLYCEGAPCGFLPPIPRMGMVTALRGMQLVLPKGVDDKTAQMLISWLEPLGVGEHPFQFKATRCVAHQPVERACVPIKQRFSAAP